MEEKVDPFLFEEGGVPLEIPWIGRKVFPRAELGGIDEDADDGDVRPRPGRAHQAEVPFMKRTHGRDEADPFPQGPVLPGNGLHLLNGPHDPHRFLPAFVRAFGLPSPLRILPDSEGLRW